jgi:hypothetical protein
LDSPTSRSRRFMRPGLVYRASAGAQGGMLRVQDWIFEKESARFSEIDRLIP